MRLKLDDIGRLAGVSRSTVSRVLNDEPYVRPEVRARVERVIRETGYAPHAAARSLVSNRTGAIGLVIPSRVHALFDDPYFGRLIQGVVLAGNRAQTSVSLSLFHDEEEEHRLAPQVIESGALDGIIVTATRIGDPMLGQIAGGRLPFVVIGRPDDTSMHHVDVDNRRGAELAARRLLAAGCGSIGMIAAPLDTTAGVDRLAGFEAGLRDAARELHEWRRPMGDFTEAGGHAAMNRLLDQGVDGVFAASDAMAMGALRAARERAVDIPSEVALVGFDGFAASDQTVPRLTTIRQPVADTAERAVQMLRRLIDGDCTPPHAEILPVSLVERDTTPTTDRPVEPTGSPDDDPTPRPPTHSSEDGT